MNSMSGVDGGTALDQMIEKVKKSDISSIRKTVSGIMRVINNPEATAKELERVIETDPPLAGRVLKLANSAYYSPQQPINNIKQAIIWIGADALRELALSQKICGLFKKERPFSFYSRHLLWKHSLAAALTAKMIYRREFKQKGENIYAAGLLHDIGIILEDQFEPDTFTALLQQPAEDRENLPLETRERDLFQFSHSQAGGALMDYWQLPPEIIHAITSHHSPADAPGEFKRAAMTLYTADYLAQTYSIGLTNLETPNQSLYDLCLVELELEQEALDLIMEDVERDVKEMEKQGLL